MSQPFLPMLMGIFNLIRAECVHCPLSFYFTDVMKGCETFNGLWERVKGDFGETCAVKCPMASIRVLAPFDIPQKSLKCCQCCGCHMAHGACGVSVQ